MIVAWRFDLLPRWALAIVIAREIGMLILSRMAIKRKLELRINWAGRIGVAPTMSAPFFAMIPLHTVALVMLYLGMSLSLLASALYIRRGLAELHRKGESAREKPQVSS
jgi:cardiolipin synthase